MNSPDQGTQSRHSPEQGVLQTPDGHALPRVLDPVVTMDLVQRFVETERMRNRRLLVLTGTVFTFVVLLILVIFVSIGLYVVRSSRRSAQTAVEARDQAVGYGVELVGISNRVEGIVNNQQRVQTEIKKVQVVREKESNVLRSDLERFAQWVAAGDRRGSKSLTELEARFKEMQNEATAREKELTALKEQYATLLTKISVGGGGTERFRDAGQPSESSGIVEAGVAARGQDAPDRALLAGEGTTKAAETPAEIAAEIPSDMPRHSEQGEISVVTFPNGDRYEGEFSDGLMNGWGSYYYRGGDRYEGEFRNDMKSGKGTLTYANGDKFLGEFKNDMRSGRGSLLFHIGDRYIGEFKNDQISGKGTFLYKNGNKYAGDFLNGLKHGNGIFRFANGDIYEGEFNEDARDGRGTYTFGDGTKYIGEFKNGQRHGNGRYIYAGGEEYVGEFRNGKKDGTGVCIYPNGKKMNGLWKEDKLVKVTEG